MRRLLVTAALALGLTFVPAVFAGGWATVQLSSTPTGVRAGKVWDVRLTVLQHGRTPLVGITPSVQISSGARRRTFPAQRRALLARLPIQRHPTQPTAMMPTVGQYRGPTSPPVRISPTV